MVSKTPVSIVVKEDGNTRFVETTYADGEIVRVQVDPNKTPTRRPKIPHKRPRVTDYTHKKRF